MWVVGSGRSPTSCAIGYGASAKSASTIRACAPVFPLTEPARRIRRDLSAHAGSATLGLPSFADAEAVDDPQVGALDRLDQLAGRLDHARGRQGLRQPKVRVAAAGPAALDQQVAGALGEERPQGVQLSGPVDVDPQKPALEDRLLLPARRRPHGGSDKQLLASQGVVLGELEQRRKPPLLAGGAAR